jgi:UDP-N-acetylglucosamine--N-acetylmuramyl-(pentapeptide) pyrophosphoryl-undecaprenol N-acetylglucosamine transferase
MASNPNSRIIVLASGGTGGHIFPAEALAEEMLLRGYIPHLITDHRFHHYNKNSSEGVLGRIQLHTIHAGTFGRSVIGTLTNAFGVVRGTWQAWRILRKLKPLAVVGFGGYPSFPTMLAAIATGQTTIIHEQNSVLGRVNRVLVGKVAQLATSYRDMKRVPKNMKRVTFTGNPVRAAIRALAQVEYPALTNDGMLRLLVIGGSQGASVFSDIVPAAMAKLPANLRARIRLDQQCRVGEIDQVRAVYSELNMQVDLAPFFVDMAARLAAAHLVVCRAGASTVAELAAAGRPAILVPLPQATDNHQYYNAQAIEDVGAGWVVTQPAFTAETLASKIEMLMHNPQRLSSCAQAMHTLGRPHAASSLADCVLKAAGVSDCQPTNGTPSPTEMAA